MKGVFKKKSLVLSVMVLMLAVVVGMGGFTFAKYISQTGTKSNQATVAKWGFVVTANATPLFGRDYRGTGLAVTGGNTGTVVVSADSSSGNVVAPGTTGSMTFSVSGKAEVLSKLTITASSTSDVLLELGETDYTPVNWTLEKDGEVVEGCENTRLATIVSKINTLDDNDQQIAPNNEASCAGNYTITWSWSFSGNDANDTILGQIANGSISANEGTYAGSKVSINFSISITIEQIQVA